MELQIVKKTDRCFKVIRKEGKVQRLFTMSESLNVKNDGAMIFFYSSDNKGIRELPPTNYKNIKVEEITYSTPEETVEKLSAIVNFSKGGSGNGGGIPPLPVSDAPNIVFGWDAKEQNWKETRLLPANFLDTSYKISRDYLPNDVRNNWDDITSLFNIPSTAHVQVRMFHSGNTHPVIIIEGEDVSGGNADLVITAPFGYGSLYNLPDTNNGYKPIQLLGVDTGSGSSGIYNASVTAEVLNTSQTIITIPKEVGHFSIRYFLGSINPTTKSLLDLMIGDNLSGKTITFTPDSRDMQYRGYSDMSAIEFISRENGSVTGSTMIGVQYLGGANDPYGFVVAEDNTTIHIIYSKNGFAEAMGMPAQPDGWISNPTYTFRENLGTIVETIMINPLEREYISGAWNFEDAKIN